MNNKESNDYARYPFAPPRLLRPTQLPLPLWERAVCHHLSMMGRSAGQHVELLLASPYGIYAHRYALSRDGRKQRRKADNGSHGHKTVLRRHRSSGSLQMGHARLYGLRAVLCVNCNAATCKRLILCKKSCCAIMHRFAASSHTIPCGRVSWSFFDFDSLERPQLATICFQETGKSRVIMFISS